MHSLDAIIAINKRGSQQCEECKTGHCEYPGSEVIIATYQITNFACFPGTTLRKKLCSGCAGGHAQRGFTVEKVEVPHAAA
jgi:hypothetical protein